MSTAGHRADPELALPAPRPFAGGVPRETGASVDARLPITGSPRVVASRLQLGSGVHPADRACASSVPCDSARVVLRRFRAALVKAGNRSTPVPAPTLTPAGSSCGSAFRHSEITPTSLPTRFDQQISGTARVPLAAKATKAASFSSPNTAGVTEHDKGYLMPGRLIGHVTTYGRSWLYPWACIAARHGPMGSSSYPFYPPQ